MSRVVVSQRARHADQASQVDAEESMALVVRLYDGMLGFLRRGAEAMASGKKTTASESIRRATDIIGELQAVLDLDEGGEIAANLDRIYAYSLRRVAEAHSQDDPSGLVEVTKLLAPLRDAWSEASARQVPGETP
ncbi:MAG: flagellar export chaperone FliS [Acidobacteriota bacterium]|nr:flagellar export chaperone FliS [Acidobacteriota bacterium]